MYMTNEEWEQNNQDYLKESYAANRRSLRLNQLVAGDYKMHLDSAYAKIYANDS